MKMIRVKVRRIHRDSYIGFSLVLSVLLVKEKSSVFKDIKFGFLVGLYTWVIDRVQCQIWPFGDFANYPPDDLFYTLARIS